MRLEGFCGSGTNMRCMLWFDVSNARFDDRLRISRVLDQTYAAVLLEYERYKAKVDRWDVRGRVVVKLNRKDSSHADFSANHRAA